MFKTNKKIKFSIIAVLCALCVFSIGGSIAYISAASDVVVNTFAGGAIAITLDEAETDLEGNVISETRVSSNTYKYLPGSVLSKDPTVTVLEDSEECYVYLYMENPLPSEYFSLDLSSDWTVVAVSDNSTLFVYKTTVDAADESVALTPLFTTVEVSYELTSEEIEDIGEQQITLQAYAVQAVGVSETTAYNLAVEYFNETFGTSFSEIEEAEAEDATEETTSEETAEEETTAVEVVEETSVTKEDTEEADVTNDVVQGASEEADVTDEEVGDEDALDEEETVVSENDDADVVVSEETETASADEELPETDSDDTEEEENAESEAEDDASTGEVLETDISISNVVCTLITDE